MANSRGLDTVAAEAAAAVAPDAPAAADRLSTAYLGGGGDLHVAGPAGGAGTGRHQGRGGQGAWRQGHSGALP